MTEPKPRIAIIGAGISGLSAAWLLRERYDVTLYEAQARAGGHADTQFVSLDGEPIAVDTGFIVFNNRNYPNLTGFFEALGIASQPSEMSFSVSAEHGRFEYAGGELHQLLAQPSNIFKLRFWRLVRDILRFNREAPALLNGTSMISLGDYLGEKGYSHVFAEDYILPMGAAIWSASVDGIRAFPAKSFIQFFRNHGLLQLTDRPQWRTVTGGSKTYIDRVLLSLANVRLADEVRAVRRTENGLAVETTQRDIRGGGTFSHVIFACHADQALALLGEPTPRQAAVLGAIRFQDNFAVLHQDAAIMPRRKRAWASWNYLSDDADDHSQAVCLTYWMNLLQGIKTRQPLLVSINPHTHLDPDKIIRRKIYRHPQFDGAAMQAQEKLPEIQGKAGIWFAGAWTGYGFHEDGITSAIRVANALGVRAPWQGA
jgi:predicted NAD/FAD-binding protein